MKNDARKTIDMYIKNLFTYMLQNDLDLSDAIEMAKKATLKEIEKTNNKGDK